MDEDEWRPIAEWCLEKNDGVLTGNQEGFLHSILDEWNGSLTEGQENWLRQLEGLVAARADMRAKGVKWSVGTWRKPRAK